ncbi:hypothetical protein [Xenorhabdus szentirmaii]|uniref:Uncharacterized protein n=1 Tax=Xenorhabdus szentirmaii DSM 16338 TaxID=1427518 RepID=W1IT43_9GAMM|nr:hypothetical protein [Xenorhabdus szentirmaii]PHM30525.1 hypothetical protein Xsze_04115 [Xenorhabdus szentirmaii DSM 16338]CDL80983.1 hypothetical protein XSR1_100033 [Xenorhabdus szentirmaii DSM 16338]
MAEKKVKLTERSMRGYTGHLFMTGFKDGVTVSPVSQRKQERILSTVRSELVADTVKKPEPEKADDSGE